MEETPKRDNAQGLNDTIVKDEWEKHLSHGTTLNIILSHKQGKRRLRTSLAVLLCAFLAASFVFAYTAELGDEGALFERVFKVYAPSSGATRAYFCILRLEFLQAFYYNHFFTLLSPFLAYACIAFIINSFSARKILPLKIKYKLIIVLAALFLIYGLLRNFPELWFLRPRRIPVGFANAAALF